MKFLEINYGLWKVRTHPLFQLWVRYCTTYANQEQTKGIHYLLSHLLELSTYLNNVWVIKYESYKNLPKTVCFGEVCRKVESWWGVTSDPTFACLNIYILSKRSSFIIYKIMMVQFTFNRLKVLGQVQSGRHWTAQNNKNERFHLILWGILTWS